jgi:hypothetical protein
MELTDLAVVAKARSGDADAFRVLVERHSRPLFRLAFRMTGNQHDAEDVVQESFLRAWRQLGRFDDRASFGTWLYRTQKGHHRIDNPPERFPLQPANLHHHQGPTGGEKLAGTRIGTAQE